MSRTDSRWRLLYSGDSISVTTQTPAPIFRYRKCSFKLSSSVNHDKNHPRMILTVSTSVTAAVVIYLCSNPQVVAIQALDAYFRRRSILAYILGKIHASLFYLHVLLFRKYADSSLNELARIQFSKHLDVQTLCRIEKVVDEISTLQSAQVINNQSINEIKQAVPKFSSWHDFGFQQENPASDFRGAGQWGVIMFTYFCKTPDCERLIVESGSSSSLQAGDKPWYPLALVSIRLSMALCELLKSEKLLVYGILQHTQDWLGACQAMHCKLLIQFHDSWIRAHKLGHIRNYFDNELVLKEFENDLAIKVYKMVNV